MTIMLSKKEDIYADRERLEASYQHENNGYQRETWTGYRDIY